MLCMLPPLMSYSLAPSSTMMSCTVHGPMDSLMQPSCIVVYSVQSSTRRLPIRALFGFTLKLVKSYLPLSPQSLCVVVHPWCLPWVTSLELESNHLLVHHTTCLSSLIRQLYLDSRVKELLLHTFHFKHGQPLALFPVAHLGLGDCTYLAPYLYVLYTSPGSCLVSEGWRPFKRGSNLQGD